MTHCLLFCWEYLGPHHLARIQACEAAFPLSKITYFALTDRSDVYDFYQRTPATGVRLIAYPGVTVETLSMGRRVSAYLRYVCTTPANAIFLCHYERPEVFLTALLLRLRGKQVFVMNDSKFDDYERNVFREFLKSFFYRPYLGAIVSGERSIRYLRFLGVRGTISSGYDTVDVNAISLRSGVATPPILLPDLFFVAVSRLIERKNTEAIIKAFRMVLNRQPDDIRLVIVGNGPERKKLETLAHELSITEKVEFVGEVPNEKIAPIISRSLALLLMSVSEQWGLVVNEAVACGVPVIVSDAVGSRDSLVRNFVNGFVLEADNIEGLSEAMLTILQNPSKFRTSKSALHNADISRFADGILALLSDKR
jgi:glycosyltransferase involved in cell wall biosynthesis